MRSFVCHSSLLVLQTLFPPLPFISHQRLQGGNWAGEVLQRPLWLNNHFTFNPFQQEKLKWIPEVLLLCWVQPLQQPRIKGEVLDQRTPRVSSSQQGQFPTGAAHGAPEAPGCSVCVGRVWHCCRVPLMIQCTNGVTEVWGPPCCAPCGDSQQQGQGLSECFGDVLGVCCGGSESSPRGGFRTPWGQVWRRLCCSQSFSSEVQTDERWMGGDEERVFWSYQPQCVMIFPSLWVSCIFNFRRGSAEMLLHLQLPHTCTVLSLCLLIVLNPLKSWELFWFICYVCPLKRQFKKRGKKGFSTPVHLQSTFFNPCGFFEYSSQYLFFGLKIFFKHSWMSRAQKSLCTLCKVISVNCRELKCSKNKKIPPSLMFLSQKFLLNCVIIVSLL